MSLVLHMECIQLLQALRRRGGPHTLSFASGWVWLLEYAMPLVWQWGPHVLLGCYGLSLLLWLVCQQKWLWALLGGL